MIIIDQASISRSGLQVGWSSKILLEHSLSLRHRAENSFFNDAPDVLKELAVLLPFLGLVGGVALGLSARDGFAYGHLFFALVALFPAALCWALSKSIKHRHVATVPLTAILCLLGACVFLRDPSAAANGISPRLPILIGAWIVAVLEAIAAVGAMLFVLDLWRRGAFDKQLRPRANTRH